MWALRDGDEQFLFGAKGEQMGASRRADLAFNLGASTS